MITTHLSSCSNIPSAANDDTAFYIEQCRKWRQYYIAVFRHMGWDMENFLDSMMEDYLFHSPVFCWQWLVGLYDDLQAVSKLRKLARRQSLQSLAESRADRITREYRRNRQYVNSLR